VTFSPIGISISQTLHRSGSIERISVKTAEKRELDKAAHEMRDQNAKGRSESDEPDTDETPAVPSDAAPL
jgi:hypothetical protein